MENVLKVFTDFSQKSLAQCAAPVVSQAKTKSQMEVAIRHLHLGAKDAMRAYASISQGEQLHLEMMNSKLKVIYSQLERKQTINLETVANEMRDLANSIAYDQLLLVVENYQYNEVKLMARALYGTWAHGESSFEREYLSKVAKKWTKNNESISNLVKELKRKFPITGKEKPVIWLLNK